MRFTVIGLLILLTAASPQHLVFSNVADIGRQLGAKPETITSEPTTQIIFDPNDTIKVTPVRFEMTDAAASSSESMWGRGCGVVIDQMRGLPQAIVTIGTGTTWYAECGGIRGIGRLPAELGYARFAVIYNIKSRNSDPMPSAAILLRYKGVWHADEKLMSDPRLEKAQASIPALRRALDTKHVHAQKK